ncbi:unnamed protein product [Meloidogyne enterolobii]|uniref:Uncharacterized protein n=1 Tax=Meloidogyne enterolobii TaxID=390850 RepID=A0ACB1B5V8_MELEN
MNFSKNSILPLILIIALNTFLVLAYEDKQQSENNGEVKKGKDEADNMMKMQNPPQFPELPPYLEKVLPSDAIQKLKILDKIPPPPGFERLPEDVRNKLKAIHRNKEKSWAQKQQELQA